MVPIIVVNRLANIALGLLAFEFRSIRFIVLKRKGKAICDHLELLNPVN